MVPVDVDFRQSQLYIKTIVDKIKSGSIEYLTFGTVDPRFFELCWCNLRPERLIVRSNPELDRYNTVGDRSCETGWSVCRGHGLLETLETFIIEDHVIHGLEMLTEYNGKRYSEIPRHLQRRIEETPIEVYVDNSFFNTDNTDAVDLYCNVVNNLV